MHKHIYLHATVATKNYNNKISTKITTIILVVLPCNKDYNNSGNIEFEKTKLQQKRLQQKHWKHCNNKYNNNSANICSKINSKVEVWFAQVVCDNTKTTKLNSNITKIKIKNYRENSVVDWNPE